MDIDHSALFIGHSEYYDITSDDVKPMIIAFIKRGVCTFYNGGQGGFDRLCAKLVYELKDEYPQIKNVLVIPYLNFNIFNKAYFDEIIYPEGFEKYSYKAAIPQRNKYMVEHSAYAICYIDHRWGGAYKTYELAEKKDLKIINTAKRLREPPRT